jgi:hypothetical protein
MIPATSTSAISRRSMEGKLNLWMSTVLKRRARYERDMGDFLYDQRQSHTGAGGAGNYSDGRDN